MARVDAFVGVLLVVAYSRGGRQALRNACDAHPGVVVRRFGRAALLAETELGALLALRLRDEYEAQVERTAPLNEFEDVPDEVRAAAAAYADRDTPSTPYAKFAAGSEYPSPEELRDAEL
jgi:hypothetical protein